MDYQQIPFCVLNISNDEAQLLLETLKNCENTCQISLLEKAFAKFIDIPYAIATYDGSSALHLTLSAIGIGRGDKVICSVNSHPFIPEAIRHCNAEPILVDINENSYHLLHSECEKILQTSPKKIKALILSHTAGYAADPEAFYDLKTRYNISIIEDATMALGLCYKNQRIGSLEADVTIFSFALERPNALANGGMIVTKNENIAHKMKLLRHHGITREEYAINRPSYMYDVTHIGYRYDTTQVNAAFCLAQLGKIDAMSLRRQEIAQLYTKHLEGIPHINPPINNPNSIHTAYIIRVDKNRDTVARELSRVGVSTDLHFIPIHLLTYYKNKYNFRVNQFPNALNNYQKILSLPIYSKLKDEEVEFVCKQIRKINQKWM